MSCLVLCLMALAVCGSVLSLTACPLIQLVLPSFGYFCTSPREHIVNDRIQWSGGLLQNTPAGLATAEQEPESRGAGALHQRPPHWSQKALQNNRVWRPPGRRPARPLELPTPQLEPWGFTRAPGCDLRTLTQLNELGVIISKALGICFIIWLPLVVQCVCVCGPALSE